MLFRSDALFPPCNDNAKVWREACRASATKKSNAKLSVGDVVKFAKPMSFGSFSEDTFTFEKYGNKDSFRATNGVLCRITKWKTRDFTVMKGEANE